MATRKPFIKTMILSSIFVGLTVYTGACVLLFAFQNRLVFVPHRALEGDPSVVGLNHRPLWIKTGDAQRIHGWWVPTSAPPRLHDPTRPQERRPYTVLFFHGNGGNISHRLDTIRVLHDLGLNTLIIDYQGYGQSDGQPSEARTYDDAQAAWTYLTSELGVEPGRLIIFGRSLGGAVAAKLAAEHPARLLVLESTFTSIPELAKERFPIFPVRWLSRVRYDSLSQMAELRLPVLVVHSPQDATIPYHHGRALYDAALSPKAFMVLRGGHNAGFLEPDYPETLTVHLNRLLHDT